ncbi:protein Wnt-1 [Clonorchis sinensis]|uniref:Protein Wnt n=1 Tax=Clonorchis sinensis TaxID=79923 RepID=G7Y317_CLOSI|nr:protein Wnt-1 [Clonorchis sinensis]
MADRLRERIELYRKWMSPRQWKQFLSETLPGRENQRFNLALFEAASVGVRRAVAECRFQFRYERWNCSQSSDEDTALFGNILLKGIPQTAFVYSIINAGIVQSVAEACLGQIDNCPCNNRGREISSADWQWQGCDHNIHFGSKFSRRLLDTMERGSHIRYRMNLHNNKVGRMLVTRNMERHCRCHGTSGSCTLRTCYRRTPRMRTLGNLLKQMYERHLVRLQPNQEGHKFSMENVKILAYGDTNHGREFLEAWYSTTDSINRCIELDPIYAPLRAKDQLLHRNTREEANIGFTNQEARNCWESDQQRSQAGTQRGQRQRSPQHRSEHEDTGGQAHNSCGHRSIRTRDNRTTNETDQPNNQS